jgi:chromosome segregation ATPase
MTRTTEEIQRARHNNWRNTTVTVGLLVAIVVGAGSIIGGYRWGTTEVDSRITKALSTHDQSVKAHGGAIVDLPRRLDKLTNRIEQLTREVSTLVERQQRMFRIVRTLKGRIR